MAKKVTIPKKLFVVAKEDWLYDYVNGEHIKTPLQPFGFLNSYSETKGLESKHQTQYKWAYNLSYYDAENIKEQPDGSLLIERTIAYYGKNEDIVVQPPYTPQIWDNDPISGFKILKSVSRYSTSNKVWRILDPRGIQFEITTGCLENIIMETAIIKGEMIGKFVWAGNKNLIWVGE